MNEREYFKALNGIRAVKKQLRKTLGMLIQAMESHELAEPCHSYSIADLDFMIADDTIYDNLIKAAIFCPIAEKWYKSTRDRMAKEGK